METQVGFRFHPTDDEIVKHYLWNKMVGRSDLTRAIAEIDVYGCEPWELPHRSRVHSGDRNWYFFYRQSKRSSGGWSRRTGQGFWKKTGQDRKIKDPDDSSSVIGTKKTLVFHNGRSGNGVRTDWVMHEYSPAPSAALPDAMAYVVCRIKYKGDDKSEVLSPCGSSNNNAAANNALPEVHPQQNVESVNRQKEADFEMALQMSIRDEGLSIEDLSPLRSGSNSNQDWMQGGGISLEDLSPLRSGSNSNQDWMQGGGISLEDLWLVEGDDNEADAMQIQVDTIEQEDDFVNSFFADPDDQLSDQDVYDLLNDHAPSSSLRGAYAEDCHGTDAQLFNQFLRNSGIYNSPSGSKQEHEQRMETAVKHDDLLFMNPSGVDSTIATGFAVNPTGEGLSTPPGPPKPRNEFRSNRFGLVVEKCVAQGDFSSKTLSGVKAIKSVDHGPSNVHMRTDTPAPKFCNKDQKMNKQTVIKFSSSSLRGAYAEDCRGTDAQSFNQLLRNSGMYNSPSGSKQEHEKRMETAVKHDDILLMNPSGVDSAITTGFAVNPTGEGLSTPPGPRKPRNELRSNRVGAVADKSARIVLQGGFSSKTLPGVKAIKSVDHGPSNVYIRTDTSASKSCNKDQKMNSRGSASSDSKSSSSSSTVVVPKGEEFPPSVFILNVAVGLMIFVAIVLHAWPCSEY